MIFEIVYGKDYFSHVTHRAFVEAHSIERAIEIFNNRYENCVIRSVVFRALTVEGFTDATQFG
jgi:hypothetical protein